MPQIRAMPKFFASLTFLAGALVAWPGLFLVGQNPTHRILTVVLAMLLAAMLLFGFVCLLVVHWHEVKGYFEDASVLVRDHPRRALVVILLLVGYSGMVFGTVVVIPFAINYSDKRNQLPPSEIAANPPGNIKQAALSPIVETQPLEALEIQLSSTRLMPFDGVLVMLVQMGGNATSDLNRAEISDASGYVSFPAVEDGDYVLVSLSFVSDKSVMFCSSRLQLRGSRSMISWKINPEPFPAFVLNLDEFQMNSAKLRGEHLKSVDQIASMARNNVFLLFGCTDSRGRTEFNDALGGDRAKAVADQLLQRRVPDYKLRLFTLGERNPAVQSYAQGTPKNRRVICLVVSEKLRFVQLTKA